MQEEKNVSDEHIFDLLSGVILLTKAHRASRLFKLVVGDQTE